MLHRIVGIAAGASTLMLLAGCGPRETSAQARESASARADEIATKREQALAMDAMDAFLQRLKSGDRIVAQQSVLAPSDAKLRQVLEDDLQRTIDHWKLGTLWIESLESRVAGDWALVVTRVTMRRDGRMDMTLRDEFVRRTDGQWKIAPMVVRSDAAIRPLINDDFKSLLKWFRENRVRLEDAYVHAEAERVPE